MMTANTKAEQREFAAYIGIDWAEQMNYWSMRTADGEEQQGQFKNTPETIQEWAGGLAQRFPGRLIAVALEQKRGALVAMLSKYAHLVLFPIHPNTLNNYRQAFTPSGAKSDGRDADLAKELIVLHGDKLRRLNPDTVETRKLQFLTEERRGLVNQHSAESQRLQAWLKQVFPQMLVWFSDPTCAMVGDFLQRWPSLTEAQKATPKTLRTFFTRHNCRSAELIEQRIAQIRMAVAATNDPALMEAGKLCIQNSVGLLGQMREGIAKFDEQIEQTYAAHPDRFIMESFPGAGPALEPRLIAAVGTLRDRFTSANSLACFVGIAPVKEASGDQKWIHLRWACPKFIRQTFHEWAGCSIRTCGWAREHYDKQRDKGKGHHAAIRSVAFKWIRIFFRCWRDRVPYCEETYLKARQRHAPKGESTPVATQTKQDGNVQWISCGGFSKPSQISS
jgi:transposase